jgi:hypothetical protein
MIKLKSLGSLVLLIYLFCISINFSFGAPVEINYGETVIVTNFNFQSSSFLDDPVNTTPPYSSPARTSTASNNIASTSVTANTYQAGMAQAQTGIQFSLNYGTMDWADVKDTPVKVILHFSYSISALYNSETGSANASVTYNLYGVNGFPAYSHIGTQTGTTGNIDDSIIAEYLTTYGELNDKYYNMIYVTSLSQAHVVPEGTAFNTSSSYIDIHSITLTPVANVNIGSQLDIYTGAIDQKEPYSAFDSVNSRFLVVWLDGPSDSNDYNIYGQFVNTNGSPYGSPVPISTASDIQQYIERGCGNIIAFDPNSQRFLVTWMDYRNYQSNIYGQLVNADGSLYGDNFPISAIDQYGAVPTVSFDSINNRFLVVWQGTPGAPDNVYGRLVNPDGSIHNSVIQITNYSTNYYAAFPDIAFDQNNGRFLVTWGQQYDGFIYGRLINSDGTLYGDEITIDSYGPGSYLAALSFDPGNSRFLIAYIKGDYPWGRLVNADGTLSGDGFKISDYRYRSFPSVSFDTDNNKFLLVGHEQLTYNGLYGQFLNPDGGAYGLDFVILSNASTSPIVSSVAFGSGEIGSLVVWHNWAPTSGQDIFGKFVKLENGFEGDLDNDSDVDGSDLALLIANTSLVNITTFAQNFGKSDCQ